MIEHDFAMFRLSFGFVVLLCHAWLVGVCPWYCMMYTLICFDLLIRWYCMKSTNKTGNQAVLAMPGSVWQLVIYKYIDNYIILDIPHTRWGKGFVNSLPSAITAGPQSLLAKQAWTDVVEHLVVEHIFSMIMCTVIACTTRHGQIVCTGVDLSHHCWASVITYKVRHGARCS